MRRSCWVCLMLCAPASPILHLVGHPLPSCLVFRQAEADPHAARLCFTPALLPASDPSLHRAALLCRGAVADARLELGVLLDLFVGSPIQKMEQRGRPLSGGHRSRRQCMEGGGGVQRKLWRYSELTCTQSSHILRAHI